MTWVYCRHIKWKMFNIFCFDWFAMLTFQYKSKQIPRGNIGLVISHLAENVLLAHRAYNQNFVLKIYFCYVELLYLFEKGNTLRTTLYRKRQWLLSWIATKKWSKRSNGSVEEWEIFFFSPKRVSWMGYVLPKKEKDLDLFTR